MTNSNGIVTLKGTPMLADIISDIAAPKVLNVTRTNDMEMAIVPHWEDNRGDGSGPAPSPFRAAASAVQHTRTAGVPEGTPAYLV